MAHADLLQELKEGIQTGRIPLITNPYIEESYRTEYAVPFIKALEAGIDALYTRQTETERTQRCSAGRHRNHPASHSRTEETEPTHLTPLRSL